MPLRNRTGAREGIIGNMVEPCSFAAESMAVPATVSGERDAQAWATVQGDHWVKPGRRASSEDP